MQITISYKEINTRREGDNVISNPQIIATLADASELTGSEKQVAWAQDLRIGSIRYLAEKMIFAETKVGNGLYDVAQLDAAISKINGLFPKVADKLAAITSAKVWINGRGDDAMTVLRNQAIYARD